MSGTKQECAYCGRVRPTTSEHFVPKGLFPKPRPNMQTIQVCKDCNGAKSQNDNFIRDILACDIHADHHPSAVKLRNGVITRSVMRRQSAITRDMLATAKPASVRKFKGLIPVEAVAMTFNADRFATAIFDMARGAYYKIAGYRLPSETPFEVRRVLPPSMNGFWKALSVQTLNGPYAIGDVFKCWFLMAEDSPTHTLWIFSFYDNILVTCATGDLGEAPSDSGADPSA